MKKDTLKRMLNAVYELEALIEMGLRRQDAPDAYRNLIEAKAGEISTLASALDEAETPVDADEIPMENIISSDDSEALEEELDSDALIAEEQEEEREESEEEEVREIPQLEPLTEPQANRESLVNKPGNTTDLRKIFSVNDKFRFRRELFRGNQKEFEKTLDDLSQISPEGCDEYLSSLRGYNAENEVWIEFTDKIKKALEK